MTKEIPLTQGKVAIVDDDDYLQISLLKWHLSANKYAAHSVRVNGQNKQIYLHRFITNAQSGVQVDHIDGDSLNNTKRNLRLCTNIENSRNQKKRIHGTTSRFKGVAWHKKANKWCAQIMSHGKYIHLGLFLHEIEAARAYDEAAKKLHGQFAKLNFSSTENENGN